MAPSQSEEKYEHSLEFDGIWQCFGTGTERLTTRVKENSTIYCQAMRPKNSERYAVSDLLTSGTVQGAFTLSRNLDAGYKNLPESVNAHFLSHGFQSLRIFDTS